MESDRRKIYRCWHNIKRRCLNETCSSYKSYGGQGITICDEWLDFESFYRWAANSGFKPSLVIDRVDPYKGYYPGNCRWVTKSENCRRQKRPHNSYRTFKKIGMDKDDKGRLVKRPGMKLREYLEKHRLSIKDFAASGGWSYMTVYFWMYGKDQYRRVPNQENMQTIKKLTKGRVRPNDFY